MFSVTYTLTTKYLGRQIEGDENGVALAADQSFPEVEP